MGGVIIDMEISAKTHPFLFPFNTINLLMLPSEHLSLPDTQQLCMLGSLITSGAAPRHWVGVELSKIPVDTQIKLPHDASCLNFGYKITHQSGLRIPDINYLLPSCNNCSSPYT
jgi:hypothetical protein